MMPLIQEQLPHLLALAHDKSREGRLLLARALADLFLTENISLTLIETDQLNGLIDELLSTQDAIVREELAHRFAAAAAVSRPLAVRIALKSVEIAHDILVNSSQLTEEDLIAVVEQKGLTHARLIAKRRIVAEAVTDALITTGDLEVMQSVAENLGARLSPKALRLLAEAARMTSSLQKPIAQRPELTEEIAIKLYWWVAQDLRHQLLERFGISQGRLHERLADAISERLELSQMQKNDEAAMRYLADWLAERDAVSISLLPRLLRLGHFRLFNILLSRMAGLKLEVIDMVTNEAGGRALATLCRAIGVDKPNFVSIFLLARGARPGEHIVHPRELSFALAAFDRQTVEAAMETILTWRVKTAMTRAEAEQETVAAGA